jgi:acyl-CoA thioesterase FadM
MSGVTSAYHPRMLLEAAGIPVGLITKNGIGPVLVDTEISYHKPLFLSDTVNAELWISELSKASAWFAFRFLNQNNELAASGRQRSVHKLFQRQAAPYNC